MMSLLWRRVKQHRVHQQRWRRKEHHLRRISQSLKSLMKMMKRNAPSVFHTLRTTKMSGECNICRDRLGVFSCCQNFSKDVKRFSGVFVSRSNIWVDTPLGIHPQSLGQPEQSARLYQHAIVREQSYLREYVHQNFYYSSLKEWSMSTHLNTCLIQLEYSYHLRGSKTVDLLPFFIQFNQL